MTPFAWAVVCFVVFDLAIAVFIVRAITSSAFENLIDAYPAVEPREPHTVRKRQSFSMGLLNFGFCVRVGLDDTHLHLAPEPYIKWSGMPSMSIPLDRVRAKQSSLAKWAAKAIIVDSDRAETELQCPKWLFKIFYDENSPHSG